MTGRTPRACRVATVLLALATGACVSPPEQRAPASAAAPSAASQTTPASAYEQRLREQALAQSRQGRLADAALSWELLTVLRPDAGDYRERMNETRRLIDAAVPERMRRGQQAQKRGELDAATTQYLAVLALQPDHEQAAEALRAIERERNRIHYLGKYSRITLERRGGTALQSTAKRPVAPLDVNDVEHAAMLRTQGELDAAIALLERHLAQQGPEPKACQMLAEMTLQKSRQPQAAGTRAAVPPNPPGNGAAKVSSPCP
jgi:tetratricopeptide (TPR) repeat protein